jgi:hypothetical protein
MNEKQARQDLSKALRSVRRRLFLRGAVRTGAIAAAALLALGTVAVAADQRWFDGTSSVSIAIVLAAAWGFTTLLGGLLRVGSPGGAAHTIDEMAALKDRTVSAQQFLKKGELDVPRQVQVQDAIAHVRALNMKTLFDRDRSRVAAMVPVLAVFLALSFFVPPQPPTPAEAAVDMTRAHQLEELRALEEEFERRIEADEDLQETLEQLREIERRLETGEMQEREVMLELSRLDEQLKAEMAKVDVAKISADIQTVMPHLMAAAATRPVGEALKNKEMEKAAEEMEKLGDQVEKNELSKEEQQKMANNMGVAASKLGENAEGSLGSDFENASESLKNSDGEGFKSSSKKMGDKFRQAGKMDKLAKLRQQLAMSKASMSQLSECKACSGDGCSACNGTGKKPGNGDGQGDGGGKGGLKAGTQATGNPLGNGTRLADSYREMVEVSLMAGDGPVESEVQETEGKTGESQISAKDLYSEYEAVAEQAIDSEEIPLSHRFHVKRYFQSIRPEE